MYYYGPFLFTYLYVCLCCLMMITGGEINPPHINSLLMKYVLDCSFRVALHHFIFYFCTVSGLLRKHVINCFQIKVSIRGQSLRGQLKCRIIEREMYKSSIKKLK